MERALLIAEKPLVEKAIRATYEKIKGSLSFEVDFTSAAGHLVGLCEPDAYSDDWGAPWRVEVLPMIPETWKYQITNGKFHDIKKLITSNDYDFVINACDAGREGENIFYHIYDYLGTSLPVKRLWAHDQTEEEVARALQSLRDPSEFHGMRVAADLREKIDFLMGMNFSRAASLKTGQTIQVGRCIDAILGMAVSREYEIANFVPKDYFEVVNKFSKSSGEVYEGVLVNPDNTENKFRYDSRDNLDAIDFTALSYKVVDVKAGQIVTKPKKLHNIADLQMECNKKFKYTSKQVLDTAQSLYEKHQILSYPRTDCAYLSEDVASKCEEYMNALSGIAELKPFIDEIMKDKSVFAKIKADKNYVNNKKVTDHTALTPTTKKVDLSVLSPMEKNVFLTVAKRFVALFMPACVYDKVDITTASIDDKYQFLTNGKTLVNLGWRKVYKDKAEEAIIPALTSGEDVSCNESEILAKQTQPPKHFTEASMLLAMISAGKQVDDDDLRKVLEACEGIGTGATRDSLIEKTIKYEWLERITSGSSVWLIPTPKGFKIAEILKGQSILSPILTAEWERKFRVIEQTNDDGDSVYDEAVAYVTKTTQEFLDTLPVLSSGGPKTLAPCPVCKKGNILLGKKSYFCSGFLDRDEQDKPACAFSIPKTLCGATISERDASELLLKGCTPEKQFTFKDGSKNKTRLIIGQDKDGRTSVVFQPFSAVDVGACPNCGKRVLQGKNSYYCEGYRDTFEDGSPMCHFGFQRTICGKNISERDAKRILSEGKSNEMTFINPNAKSKTDNKFKQTLVLKKQEDGTHRVEFFKFEDRVIGQCPFCQKQLLEKRFAFSCEAYERDVEGACQFSLSKELRGVTFTEDDVKRLCEHSETDKKWFTWQSGKKGQATMKVLEEDGVKKIGFGFDS